MKRTLSRSFIFILILVSTSLHAAAPISDPCGGQTALLNLVDRPTVGDSPCVVHNKSELLEVGSQYQSLMFQGTGENLPEAVFRIGLPASNELVLLLPNYFHQSVSPRAGFSSSTFGLKHEFGYDAHSIYTAEVLITLPGGSQAFGNRGLGAAVNGIMSYSFTQEISLVGLFGVSSQTLPPLDGGGRFSSFNPDFVLSWNKNHTSLYVEIYGQSKTAPQAGSGFNMDAGLLYLVSQNLVVDFEVGQRLSGTLGGFNHYVGSGVSIFFP
jgi:hypothetical protein